MSGATAALNKAKASCSTSHSAKCSRLSSPAPQKTQYSISAWRKNLWRLAVPIVFKRIWKAAQRRLWDRDCGIRAKLLHTTVGSRFRRRSLCWRYASMWSSSATDNILQTSRCAVPGPCCCRRPMTESKVCPTLWKKNWNAWLKCLRIRIGCESSVGAASSSYKLSKYDSSFLAVATKPATFTCRMLCKREAMPKNRGR